MAKHDTNERPEPAAVDIVLILVMIAATIVLAIATFLLFLSEVLGMHREGGFVQSLLTVAVSTQMFVFAYMLLGLVRLPWMIKNDIACREWKSKSRTQNSATFESAIRTKRKLGRSLLDYIE